MTTTDIQSKIENLDLENKYSDMTEIEHILERAAMYIGSITPVAKENVLLYKPSESKIVNIKAINYIAGLMKIFDEVFTNSIDERRRESKLYNVTEINVEIFKSGKVIIRDNGGIAIKPKKYKNENILLPRFLFGYLRTSSNYIESRDGAGLNGIGAKIANIFSSSFKLTTADGVKKGIFHWKNNMHDFANEEITLAKKGEHFSEFEFDIELHRFDGLKEFDISVARLIQKRCIDGAAANPGLKITFKTDLADGALNSDWQFESFEQFVNLHLNEYESKNLITYKYPNGDVFSFFPSSDKHYSFINGAVCLSKESTHIKKAQKGVNDYILKLLEDKNIELITDKDINNHLSYFINFSFSNPEYDSQTKEKFTSKLSTHSLVLPKEKLEEINNNKIIEELVDYYNHKYLKEQKKKLTNLNKALKNTKSKKLTECGSRNPISKELWVFEGTSAANGFRSWRNPTFQAGYELRGKIMNALNLTREQIVENEELRELIAILKLQFADPVGNLKNLDFHKIILGTDADVDGLHINGLFLALMAKHFPELLKAKKIYRLQSPIIIAEHKKTKEELWYYSLKDYEVDKKKHAGKFFKDYEVEYYKGLGSLSDNHYERLIRAPRLLQFSLKDVENYMKTINIWFGKNADLRKEQLLLDGNGED